MIVEMTGLPGSGKSTIARLICAADLRARRHIAVPSKAVALRHPWQTMLESTRPSGIGRGTGWPAWPKLWLRWQDQLRLPVIPGTVDLVEEGVCHHVWRALFRRPGLNRTPWRGLLTLPHPLLVLDTDRPTRQERIAGKARRGPVNRHLALPTSTADWDRAESLMTMILESLPAERPVFRVLTSGDLPATLAQVTAVIAGLS